MAKEWRYCMREVGDSPTYHVLTRSPAQHLQSLKHQHSQRANLHRHAVIRLHNRDRRRPQAQGCRRRQKEEEEEEAEVRRDGRRYPVRVHRHRKAPGIRRRRYKIALAHTPSLIITRHSCAVYKGGRRQEEDGGRATARRDEAQAAGRAPEARWRQDTQGEGRGAEQIPERAQRASRHAQDRSRLRRLAQSSNATPRGAQSGTQHAGSYSCMELEEGWQRFDTRLSSQGFEGMRGQKMSHHLVVETQSTAARHTVSISFSKDAVLSRMKLSLWYALTLVHGCFDEAQEASLQICPAYLVKSVSRCCCC
jgi:hypothetical protein